MTEEAGGLGIEKMSGKYWGMERRVEVDWTMRIRWRREGELGGLDSKRNFCGVTTKAQETKGF